MIAMSAEDGGGASTSAEEGTTLEKVRKSRQTWEGGSAWISLDVSLPLPCLACALSQHSRSHLGGLSERILTEKPLSRTQVMKSNALKVILLGNAAAGKSKLIERFLLEGYVPHRLSTYAVTIYNHVWKKADGDEEHRRECPEGEADEQGSAGFG